MLTAFQYTALKPLIDEYEKSLRDSKEPKKMTDLEMRKERYKKNFLLKPRKVSPNR